MTAIDHAQRPTSAEPGLLERARTVAKPGFNRWLVPPAALAIHLSIGMAYALSDVLEAAVQSRPGRRQRRLQGDRLLSTC